MRLIGLLVAIVLGVGTFLVTMQLTKKPEEEKVTVVEVPVVEVQEVPTVDILVARDMVPIGTELQPQHLDRQPWPSHLILDDFIVSDGDDSDIIGLVTRSNFQSREPLIRNKLANPEDPSFLAATLGAGMRAVTLAVDELSGVGGFVFPGDNVDVIINHEVPVGPIDDNDPSAGQRMERVSELLLGNVKVLAVDQQSSMETGLGPQVPSSVTVAVTRSQAQKAKLAENYGRLSLALRSIEDGENTKSVRPTGISDLSRITPPSFFPVLYDSDADYDVNPIEMQESNLTPDDMDGMDERVSNPVTGAVSSGSITVVRGADRESVGVDRP